METDVYLEGHDRDFRLRIISGGDEYIQSLVAAWRFLINHLVAMNIKAVGMILEAAIEPRIEIPLRESNSDVIMPRHSLHHGCGGAFRLACARRYRLFEQLRRPTELCDRGVAVLAADAPVQSVFGVVEHIFRRLKEAES